jgi:hypothetical protein
MGLFPTQKFYQYQPTLTNSAGNFEGNKWKELRGHAIGAKLGVLAGPNEICWVELVE